MPKHHTGVMLVFLPEMGLIQAIISNGRGVYDWQVYFKTHISALFYKIALSWGFKRSLNMNIDWNQTIAAVWRPRQECLKVVEDVDLMDMDRLIGIERQKLAFCENVENFLEGGSCNHVLLWGARGTGKSSLVKAALNTYHDKGLRVIEIPKDDLSWLIEITDEIRKLDYRFLIFCDDLSFEDGETSYKELKSTLQGSIEKPPENVLIVATSNRRHLIPEKMSDNLQAEVVNGEIHHNDTTEEKMSLSDRSGLSLSFYPIKQDDYFAIVDMLFQLFAYLFVSLPFVPYSFYLKTNKSIIQ